MAKGPAGPFAILPYVYKKRGNDVKKRWILQTKRADFREIGRKYGMDPVTAKCMVNRGVAEDNAIEQYLRGTWQQISSPWLMKDMEKAVERIVAHKDQSAAIASDFDCDGIFSAYILKKGLEECGIQSKIYTPDRVAEGYGLNRRIVEEALADRAGFLITCDNGIAANAEIQYAKEKSLPVIVTDHHEVQEEIPVADAVVDPKQPDCPYPFDGLCGAGVAFQLIRALYERMGVSEKKLEGLLEYVAIATVADVMELSGENRVIVKEGIRRLKSTTNYGLRAMLEVQNLLETDLKAYHIGFVIGPCFNAAGRIDTVEKAFQLLESESYSQAIRRARELKEINDMRKQLTEEATAEAFQRLQEGDKLENDVYVLLLPDCHESLVGIVAGRIKEAYHHPVIVFTRVGDGLVKGSGRSIEGYHMFEKLMMCRDRMIRFGGHKMAAGMTLQEADLPELEECLNAASGLREEDFHPTLEIDVALPLSRITEALIDDLEKLEPFGNGNPKPVFAEQHFRLLRAAKRGKYKNVLSLKVANSEGVVMDAVCFERVEEWEQLICDEWGEEELQKVYCGRENRVDLGLAYYPSVNEYGGSRTLQIIVTDFCRISR